MLAGVGRLNRLLRLSHWCVLFAIVLSMLSSALCVSLMGISVPRVHDEFAYLLGADTFASGRLSNPTHPMWEHFESFHVLSKPSFMPKYPPAQSVVLAVGQRLGHPYLGVCLSSALAAGALTWMMIAWVPWRYRWLCVAFSGLSPGLHIKWGHSYLGGAIAVLAASLLLGALFRSLRILQVRQSILAAVGIGLLAISRPFEGAVLTLFVSVILLIRIGRAGQWRLAFQKVFVPAGIVLAFFAAGLMVNNSRVTGHPLRLAYQIYEQQYGRLPLFLWQAAKADPPQYRHDVFKVYYDGEATEAARKFSSFGSIIVQKGKSLLEVIHFIAGGCEYFLFLLVLPLAWYSSRFRLILWLLIPTLLAAAATPWTLTHYAAPAMPLVLMLIVLALVRILKLLRRHQQSVFSGIVVAIAAALFGLHGWALFQVDQQLNQTPWAIRRQQMQQELTEQPGLDLVLVSYSSQHNPHQEWVYNQADIDGAEVVWARSISEEADQRLIEYFSNRRVHRLQID
ncbi:MAG: hypothetical protein U0930_07080 [Pirellulales bacterium]